MTEKAEIATAYTEMMNGWAFKDLMARIENENRDKISQILSQKGADNLEWTKGFNACVEFIKTEIGFVMSGK